MYRNFGGMDRETPGHIDSCIKGLRLDELNSPYLLFEYSNYFSLPFAITTTVSTTKNRLSPKKSTSFHYTSTKQKQKKCSRKLPLPLSPPPLLLQLGSQASFAVLLPAVSRTRRRLLTASYAKSATTSFNFCVPFASTVSDSRDAALAIESSPHQGQGSTSFLIFFPDIQLEMDSSPPRRKKKYRPSHL